MPLSIKQKQVLGITTIVVLIVVALSLLQIGTLVRVLLEQATLRAELVSTGIFHQTRDVLVSRETAYQDIRSSPTVLSALESAMYSPEVLYAAIVDRTRTVIASNDPSQVGRTLPAGEDLPRLVAATGTIRCGRFTPKAARSSGASRCRLATSRSARSASGCRRS